MIKNKLEKMIRGILNKITELWIPKACVFCAKDMSKENIDICKKCSEKCIKKYSTKEEGKLKIQEISSNIKHIYITEYPNIKKEIFDIKYYGHPYKIDGILEAYKNEINTKIFSEGVKHGIIYMPTGVKKYIQRGVNISKKMAQKLKNIVDLESDANSGKDTEIFKIAKVNKDIELKSEGKEARREKVKLKFGEIYSQEELYKNLIDRFELEKENTKKIQILIVDDVYTTGATSMYMYSILENVIKKIEQEHSVKVDFRIFTLAKD